MSLHRHWLKPGSESSRCKAGKRGVFPGQCINKAGADGLCRRHSRTKGAKVTFTPIDKSFTGVLIAPVDSGRASWSLEASRDTTTDVNWFAWARGCRVRITVERLEDE